MKKHDPIKLNPAERTDLASITKHPGMTVLVERIVEGHVNQQLAMIFDVQPDDADRVTKLSAIAETAYAMELFSKLVQDELARNWGILQQEEESRARAAKNEAEKTQ
jgi:hypothetical protein